MSAHRWAPTWLSNGILSSKLSTKEARWSSSSSSTPTGAWSAEQTSRWARETGHDGQVGPEAQRALAAAAGVVEAVRAPAAASSGSDTCRLQSAFGMVWCRGPCDRCKPHDNCPRLLGQLGQRR